MKNPVIIFITILSSITMLFSQTTVFINEIHYDNDGTDSGEAVEIAGPAGTDLTGWSIELYNGSGGALYDTDSFSGVIPDLCGGYGTVTINYPVNGLQNGSPDGIALINSGTVVQFLSYEGSLTATSGTANGMTSTDIVVNEPSTTPVGFSLQLSGTGSTYEDFTWNAPASNTFDACNTGQTFVAGVDLAPGVFSTTPTNLATNVAIDSDIIINFNEDVNVVGSWYSISGASSGIHTAVVTGGPASFTLNPDVDYSNGEVVTVIVYAAQVTDVDTDDPPDNMAADYQFSFTTTLPGTGWVINEILADPATDLTGDANGDGIRDSSDDEFVEIINATGLSVDISGWTLYDSYGLRHTFPVGTILPDQSAIVVFGGGTPTGVFGKALVQTASSGALGLNNAGDTVILNNGTVDVATYIYGAEGGNDQSLTRDPDIIGPEPLVTHSTATGSGGKLFSPGVMVNGTVFSGAYIGLFEIQGASTVDPYASPYNSQVVLTAENIVTAVGPEGFFIQTQDTRVDADANTSNGIYVYTGYAPTVSIGNMLNVTGTVNEFYEFTEINAPIIIPAGTGAVPAPIVFDASTPSPIQPQSVIEFERFEGMLISITGGIVNGPNQYFGTDPIAEVYIAAGTSRVFRETGIEYPGSPGLPIWDGNAEIFEMDPDKLGLPNIAISGGSTFDATGVLGYEFSGYELWPTSLIVTSAPLPLSVSGGGADQFSVSAFNMYRLFDNINDGGEETVTLAEYNLRLAKLSMYVRDVLQSPDILAVSEVEKLGVLNDLAAKITTDDASIVYSAYLEEGNDVSGIDVGFLVQENRMQVDAVTQLGAAETWNDPVNGPGSLLHDRPPLLLEGSFKISDTPYLYTPISVLALHIRSMNGIETDRVRQKRLNQAQSIAQMVQDLQTADPNINLIVTGDFNAFEFTDGYVDVVGQIMGDFTPSNNMLSGPDLVDPNLANSTTTSPTLPKILSPLADATDRYSFIYQGSAQALDHALFSAHLAPEVTNQEFGKGNADAAVNFANDDTTPLRSSDHDGLVLYIDAADIALPVELSSFTAQVTPQGVKLDWRTESEIENLGFIVERKTEKSDWKEIASYKTNDYLLGQGTVSYPTDYTFIDKLVQSGTTYEYRIADIDYSGNVTYHGTRKVTIEKDTKTNLPTKYGLGTNYPNPFNPTTMINYDLPKEGFVTIAIYDVTGRQIKTLINGQMPAGYHRIRWNSTDNSGNLVGAGIYFYSIQAGDFQQTKKMLLLR